MLIDRQESIAKMEPLLIAQGSMHRPALTDLVSGDSGTASQPGPSTVAAVAGYPHITVPMGFDHGLPLGLSVVGRAWSEATLIKLAYAFEQATHARRPPTFAPTADLSR